MKKRFRKMAQFQGGPRNILWFIGFVIVGLLLLARLSEYTSEVHAITYTNFMKKVAQNEVKAVQVSGQDLYGQLTNNTRFETVLPATSQDWSELRSHGVEVSITSPSASISFGTIFGFASLLLVLFMIFYLFRQARSSGGGGSGSNVFSMVKSKAKMFMPSTIKVTFADVAGSGEAKEELADVIDYLRNPEKYKRLGAKMTRGILLVGAPGTGKTLLARAVAGESSRPFFSVSGSDFIEIFVGVGAARVRDLFQQARKYAPCIVFIDEIDAVGRHRGSGLGGGNDEREQTLNQLLTEMDGFDTAEESVIVIAATNRPDVLDAALLRPGRFDRRVEVPYPDLVSREQILEVHARKITKDESVDLAKIARGTPGFTGADLENLVNEATIIASKLNKPFVTVVDFEEARDKILLGKERKSMMMSDEEKKIVAYHEAGHALVRLLMPDITDPLHKVSIIPRGTSLGVTHSLPEKEKYISTKQEMLAHVVSVLGGRSAEELAFSTVGTGASSDFNHATDTVRAMVTKYGMSETLGPVVYRQGEGAFEYSQKTAEMIDTEVRSIMDECHKKAQALLAANREKLDLLAAALLEKETMQAGEIYALLGITPREEFKLS
jgi:cell division protease FtsH